MCSYVGSVWQTTILIRSAEWFHGEWARCLPTGAKPLSTILQGFRDNKHQRQSYGCFSDENNDQQRRENNRWPSQFRLSSQSQNILPNKFLSGASATPLGAESLKRRWNGRKALRYPTIHQMMSHRTWRKQTHLLCPVHRGRVSHSAPRLLSCRTG